MCSEVPTARVVPDSSAHAPQERRVGCVNEQHTQWKPDQMSCTGELRNWAKCLTDSRRASECTVDADRTCTCGAEALCSVGMVDLVCCGAPRAPGARAPSMGRVRGLARRTRGSAGGATVCSAPQGSKRVANAGGSELGASRWPLQLPRERSWRALLQQLGQQQAGAADHLAALADQQACWCYRQRAWQLRSRRTPAALHHLTVSVARVRACAL